MKSLSRVQLPATPWTAAHQAPPSMDFPGKSTGVGCHCLLRQEAERVPYRISPRRNTPRHILIKLTKIKHKERILKAAREKQQVIYKGNPIHLTADFSAEILQARREWQDIFKVLKGKNQQPRVRYLARISFKIDGEIKSFSDKQKLRGISTTKSALQQMLKGHSQEIQEKKKDLQNHPQTIRK